MYMKMIKRRIVSIIAALVFLFAVSGCSVPEEGSDYMNISQKKAKEMMENLEEFVLLDARTEEEFSEGHIPGAILIPYDEITEKAEGILTDKDQLILVYCRCGRRSKIAAADLVKLGYTNIKEFGGIIDWPYEVE